MNQSLLLESVKDADETIVDRNHETRREQLQIQPRVHERRAVRQELQVRDDPVEPPCGLFDLGLARPVIPLRLRKVPGHAGEELLRRLDDAALVVFLEVSLLKAPQRVVHQARIRFVRDDFDELRISNLDLFHGTTLSRSDGVRRTIQAVKPSLGVSATKGVGGYISFGITYVTSTRARCYHICYHTSPLHMNVSPGRAKLLLVVRIRGTGATRRARDAWFRECRPRGRSPPQRVPCRRRRARSPRIGSATSSRS